MEEDFYFEESSKASVIKKIICMLLVIGIIAGCFIYYRINYTLHINKLIILEAGETVSLDIKDYVTNKIVNEKDYSLNVEEVPRKDGVAIKAGTFKYKVKYKNISKTGKIKVKDTIKPVVETEDIIVGVNESYEAEEFIKVCDDYSKPCVVTYKDDNGGEPYTKAGTYKVDLIVSDKYDNSVNVSANIIVKNNYSRKELYTKDLKVTKVYPDYEDFDGELLVYFKEGIDEDNIGEYEGYNDLVEILDKDFHSYLPKLYYNNRIDEAEIIYAYNKYNYIVGATVRVKLDNGLHFYLKKQ